jgi:hypothetical protein
MHGATVGLLMCRRRCRPGAVGMGSRSVKATALPERRIRPVRCIPKPVSRGPSYGADVCYGPGMSRRRAYLKEQLAEAERELDAAKKPSQIRAAATKRRVALQGLQWLDEQEAKSKPPNRRGRGSADASS